MKPITKLILRLVPGFLTIVACCLNVVSPLSAQDLPYESGSTGNDGPLVIPTPIRSIYDHAAAFNQASGELVVFGGYAGGYSNGISTRNTPSWVTSFDVGAPSPRRGHQMVYDAARGEIVLFGGQGGTGNLGDTWVWAGGTWTQKSPASSPSARYAHAMAYDSTRQKVVLFGGYSSNSETWEWDGANWTEIVAANKPAGRYDHAMAYHAGRQRVVLFGGYPNDSKTWEWDGTNWQELSFSVSPATRYMHAMAYDPVRQEVVLFGGYDDKSDTWTFGDSGWTQKTPNNQPPGRHEHTLNYDPVLQQVVMVGGSSAAAGSSTWTWDGSDWSKESDVQMTFDMSGRADGVWHYTTIDVPAGVTLFFQKNLLNSPVQWLATGDVNIAGTLNLHGEAARSNTNVESGNEAIGGPGGFNGGLGGREFSISGSYVGSPGGGPGGGAPGATQNADGAIGQYLGVYGNTFIQPLIGGSGGGGAGSTSSRNGLNGGAGGGAILIASSSDIVVNGEISTKGGAAGSTYDGGNRYAGAGSGGAIRLIGDRVTGNGRLYATGGSGRPSGGNGRIRVEAYYRPLAASSVSPSPSSGPPTETLAGLEGGTALTIASVDGENVRQPATGDTANPDVIFTDEGEVTIVVTGTNIPNGTPVSVRLATSAGIITLPAEGDPEVTMTSNSASFTVTVPAGVGTIQAYASIDVAP